MSYIEEICVAGETIEVSKYYTYRNPGKGERRRAKEKLTCAAQKKVNQRKAERDLRRLMNANFIDGDLLVRLDFVNAKFISGSEQMQKYISKFLRWMRAEFKKRNKMLKYIYVKEIGPRGGRHVHIIMSRCNTEVLRKCWPFGGIHIDPLTSGGQYKKIAAYFVKYAARTEETEGKLIGKRWNPSRNLVKPTIRKRILPAKRFRQNIKEIAGYELVKDSVTYGISDYTGYEYFTYTLIRSVPEQVRGRCEEEGDEQDWTA